MMEIEFYVDVCEGCRIVVLFIYLFLIFSSLKTKQSMQSIYINICARKTDSLMHQQIIAMPC